MNTKMRLTKRDMITVDPECNSQLLQAVISYFTSTSMKRKNDLIVVDCGDAIVSNTVQDVICLWQDIKKVNTSSPSLPTSSSPSSPSSSSRHHYRHHRLLTLNIPIGKNCTRANRTFVFCATSMCK